ncbi:hypothetical protein [Geothermobacter hydrogeniphilus]|nr:hypothetical protein [Geothermobacter hydrogeniphilus]
MSKGLETGKVMRRTVAATLPLDYYLYLPESGIKEQRVFVTIHGISRNAREHAEGFAVQAERYGAAIVAPLFPEDDFPRYQRLGNSVHEGRADSAFDRIMHDAAELIGCDPLPLRGFGFSGGGQFLHRYALFYPRRVERMVVGAPGWYTFPDPSQRYPLGLRSSKEWPRLRFNPVRFLSIPTVVLVGEEDDIRDEDLNKSRRIDAVQGLNRVERGRRWVHAMNALARAYQVPAQFRCEIIPNASHAYESYHAHPAFTERVFTHLFGVV